MKKTCSANEEIFYVENFICLRIDLTTCSCIIVQPPSWLALLLAHVLAAKQTDEQPWKISNRELKMGLQLNWWEWSLGIFDTKKSFWYDILLVIHSLIVWFVLEVLIYIDISELCKKLPSAWDREPIRHMKTGEMERRMGSKTTLVVLLVTSMVLLAASAPNHNDCSYGDTGYWFVDGVTFLLLQVVRSALPGASPAAAAPPPPGSGDLAPGMSVFLVSEFNKT